MPIILTLIAMCGIFWLRSYVFAKLMQSSKENEQNYLPLLIPFFFRK